MAMPSCLSLLIWFTHLLTQLIPNTTGIEARQRVIIDPSDKCLVFWPFYCKSICLSENRKSKIPTCPCATLLWYTFGGANLCPSSMLGPLNLVITFKILYLSYCTGNFYFQINQEYLNRFLSNLRKRLSYIFF